MGRHQSDGDVRGIKGKHDAATLGTLEKSQLCQRFHIIMNAPDTACHSPCQLTHRPGALPLQRMHRCPTMLCELAKEAARSLKIPHFALVCGR